MTVGRLLGVRLTVHPLFLILIGLYVYLGLGKELTVVAAVLAAHELAHLLAARTYGLEIEGVELLPFGGRATIWGLEEAGTAVETVVALAGPLNHLILLAGAVVADRYLPLNPELLHFFIEANLALALFNLLPALPLDGGRVLRAHLARGLGQLKATRRAAKIGMIVAVTLAAVGLLLTVLGHLIVNAFVFALFLWYSARGEYRQAPFLFVRGLIEKQSRFRREGRLPLKALIVRQETPLKRVYRQLLPDHYALIWVADDHLDICGMLSEKEIVSAMEEADFEKDVGSFLEKEDKKE